MKDSQIKIIIKDKKVVTLEELFEGKKEVRRQMANLSFEEKIKILASLQEIAQSWGEKKDVRVWKVD